MSDQPDDRKLPDPNERLTATTALAKELHEIMQRLNAIDAELRNLSHSDELPMPEKGTRLNWLTGEMQRQLARIAELMDEARRDNHPVPKTKMNRNALKIAVSLQL